MSSTTNSNPGNKNPPTSHSPLRKVLKDANADLENAELAGPFDQIRDFVRPFLAKATDVVPSISSQIPVPFTDQIGAFALGTTFHVVKVGYCHFHRDADEEARDIQKEEVLKVKHRAELEVIAKNPEYERIASILNIISLPKDFISNLIVIWGMSVNTVIDIITAPFTGKLFDWTESIKTFIGFLLYTGIDEELATVLFNPRVHDNISIMANIQANLSHNSCYARRMRASMERVPISHNTLKPLWRDIERYMRYSTAAYGVSMIKSAEELTVLPDETSNIFDYISEQWKVLDASITGGSRKTRRKKIANYVGIKEEDIIYMTPPGADSKVLGHFVAIDHNARAVVLSIRGTYSICGGLADLSSYSKPFCDGVAHSGIAERAGNLWINAETKEATVTQQIIIKALKKNPKYELVITGHSLGAGAACLLNIQLHYDDIIKNIEREHVKDLKVRCFGFACPPVYTHSSSLPMNLKVINAIKNTTCYIHKNDVIPFLSIDSVRRLVHTLEEVDQITSKMCFVERILIAKGIKKPTKELKTIIEYGSRDLPPKLGSERLAIPASFALWMQKTNENEDCLVYTAMFCDPNKISNLSIFLSKTMISDHMPARYERAIEMILGQISEGEFSCILMKSGHAFKSKK